MSRVPFALLLGALALGPTVGGTPPALPGPRVRLLSDATPGVREFSLPVPDGAVSSEALRAPHHDYPASDLMVPVGTPVFAAHAGTVVTHVGPRCGLGVTIRSREGYRSVSCHLARVAVVSGASARGGDVVGLSGDSGNAAGAPHLHFHLRDSSGRYLCPQPLFLAWRDRVDRSPAERAVTSGCSFPRRRPGPG